MRVRCVMLFPVDYGMPVIFDMLITSHVLCGSFLANPLALLELCILHGALFHVMLAFLLACNFLHGGAWLVVLFGVAVS